MTKLITWKLGKIKLGGLIEWEKNPVALSERAAKLLAKNLKEKGQDLPYVAAAPISADGRAPMLDGHQRKQVEITLNGRKPGEWVPCLFPDRKLTERERQEWVISHRKNTGTWDFDILADNFEVPDLLEWGFSEKELLGAGFEMGESADAEPQVDRADELLKKWKVKAGDLWQIGAHWLLCGDSTKRDDVERVMGGEKADMVFTDPPWNVDYTGGTKKREELENDNIECGWDEWLTTALANVQAKENAPAYVFFGLMRAGDTQRGVEAAGWRIVQTLVWVKQHAQFGNFRAHYKYQHEPMYYCSIGTKVPAFYGANNETSVWAHDRASRNDNHPTEKPIEVAMHGIKNSSRDGEIVFDGFCGGGTTIVACENLGRKARAIEISPAYCAVTLERMSQAFPALSIQRLNGSKTA